MIHKISANQPTFRTVSFEPGFNVVLAEKDDSADDKDSRNGIGKSSLIEIIHFCLGSDLKRSKTLNKPSLQSWEFTLDITIGGKRIEASRSIAQQSNIFIKGDTNSWPSQPSVDDETGQKFYSLSSWTELLGKLMFDLPIGPNKPAYSPTFRALIPFFARRGRDAYSKPFEVIRNQSAWQTQVYNSYLLDLSWEFAREWQVLKDKEEDLSALKSASQRGTFANVFGTIGELEALKLRLEGKCKEQKKQLDSFQVHPQYRDIEVRANEITKEIHQLSNDNYSARRLVSTYEASVVEEKSASKADVEQVYKEAGVLFSEKIKKRLEEVLAFHETVTRNRADFLKEEIARLHRAISNREDKIKALSNDRAVSLNVLKTHKALDEYTSLQGQLTELNAQLEEAVRKIDLLKKFEAGKSAVKIEREELKVKTRRDHEERTAARERVVALFNANSEALYNRPGQLIIDITESGLSFKIEIERSESDGIQLMEVFCYDLVLAQVWAQKERAPGFTIHDSTVFADVDERQIAHAIEAASQLSESKNFQYICFLNSDKVPWSQFSEGFDLRKYVRLELKDKPVSACLFGVRF